MSFNIFHFLREILCHAEVADTCQVIAVYKIIAKRETRERTQLRHVYRLQLSRYLNVLKKVSHKYSCTFAVDGRLKQTDKGVVAHILLWCLPRCDPTFFLFNGASIVLLIDISRPSHDIRLHAFIGDCLTAKQNIPNYIRLLALAAKPCTIQFWCKTFTLLA